MQPDQQLSPNFWLSELTSSQLAVRQRIRNEPLSGQVENLRRLVRLLEDVRTVLAGAPILVSSGYRSTQLNVAMNGAASSAHLDGRAADFSAPAFGPPRAVCQRVIDSGLVFDQLICEGDAWVHIAIAPRHASPRRETLTAIFSANEPTRYSPGIA